MSAPVLIDRPYTGNNYGARIRKWGEAEWAVARARFRASKPVRDVTLRDTLAFTCYASGHGRNYRPEPPAPIRADRSFLDSVDARPLCAFRVLWKNGGASANATREPRRDLLTDTPPEIMSITMRIPRSR